MKDIRIDTNRSGSIADTDEQKKRFAEKPDLFLRYSKMIESELNVRFKFILNGTPEAEGAREVCCSDLCYLKEKKKRITD